MEKQLKDLGICECCLPKLKEWLDAAPTVYTQEKAWGWAKRKRVHDIFKAKLVCIEEIETPSGMKCDEA